MVARTVARPLEQDALCIASALSGIDPDPLGRTLLYSLRCEERHKALYIPSRPDDTYRDNILNQGGLNPTLST
jgi:hypothetical protein